MLIWFAFGEQCSDLEKSRCDGCHVIHTNRKYCIRVLYCIEDEIKLVRVCKQSLSRDVLMQTKEDFYLLWFVCLNYITTVCRLHFLFVLSNDILSVSVSMAYYHWLLILLAGFSLFTVRVCSQGKLIEYIFSKRPS